LRWRRFRRRISARADAAAENQHGDSARLDVSIRTLRADLKVEPKEKVPVQIYANAEIRTLSTKTEAQWSGWAEPKR